MVFIPTSALIENADQDFNQVPPTRERRGTFWTFMAPVLGIEPERYPSPGSIDWQLDAVARRDQRIAALNGPPTVGEVVRDVVDAVTEAIRETVQKVKKQTAISRATEWLKLALKDGAQPQKVIEAMAKKEGISTRTLTRAKVKARVVSERKGRDYWVWRLGIVKSKDGQKE
jgi:hypothetical protein